MKRKQLMMLALTGALVAQSVLLGACGSRGTEADSAQVQEDSTAQETGAVAGEGSGSETQSAAEETGTAISEDMAVKQKDGINGFAFRFTRAMLKEKEAGENMIVSPYSVWLPLAALANATDQEARAQLLDALGKADMDVAALNEAVQTLNGALCQEEQAAWYEENNMEFESPLKIANAVFVGQNEVMKTAFTEVYEKVYGGKVFPVDFTSQTATAAVNDWASEQTNGRIEKIIDGFDPKTVAAIANAIYFSDNWAKEFPEANTQNDVFYGAAREETVPFMNNKLTSCSYTEDEEMQAVVLGTAKGGQLVICLPKEGKTPEELLADMTPEKLTEIYQSSGATVQLSLPKFKLESSVFSVKEAMELLGVPLTSALTPHIDGLVEGDPLYISQAVQKAMLEVDEKGMTAAAVTVMGLERMSMPIEQEPIEMKCDSPFAVILTADGGEAGQQVLFTGVVNQIGE